MRRANPALKKGFEKAKYNYDATERMTLQGTVNKTFILLTLIMATALYSWKVAKAGNEGLLISSLMVGSIGGLIFALITIFKPKAAPITAPIYALLEGLVLGGISALYETQKQGIVINAVVLTFGILITLIFLYKTNVIRVTENFRLGVVAATGGIFIVYLLNFILGFFGIQVPFIHSSGLMGIGISLLIVVIASLNLVLDFDFIERGVEAGAPEYMEWYGAFGLMVTLIWLYMEILRLLSKLRSRD